MATVMPFCRYNHSLNKYLLYNSNISLDLDLFNYYASFNSKLALAKNFFFKKLVSDHHPLWNGGHRTMSLCDVLLNFASYLVKKLKINPYNELWEETLANWPIFKGAALLDVCRTQYDMYQEKRERIVKALEARAARAAEKEKKRKVALLVPLVEKLIAYMKRKEAKALCREHFPSGENATVGEVVSATAAGRKAEKTIRAYRKMRQTVWRVKRQETTAARLKEEEEIVARFESGVQCVAGPSTPPSEGAVKRRGRGKEVHIVAKDPLWDLYPAVGLGAKIADPVCSVITACTRIADTRPDLVSVIYAFITGDGARWLNMERAHLLCKKIVMLSDWYPHELLAEELKKISDLETCKAAEDTINQEFARMKVIEENARASNWWSKVKGCPQALLNKIVDFGSAPFRQYAKSAAEYLEGFSHRIVDVFMSKLRSVVQTFCSELGLARAFIEEIVGHVKRWYANLCASFDETLALLGKWGGLALGLIVGVGICHLIEVVVSYSKFNISGILTTTFATTFMAWMFSKTSVCTEAMADIKIAISKFAHGFFETTRNFVHLSTIGRSRNGLAASSVYAPYTVHPAVFDIGETSSAGRWSAAPEEEDNARAVPVLTPIIHAMASFGTSLMGMKTSAFIEFGKLGAAAHSLRMGKDALLEFVGAVLYYFGRVADKVTGRETQFFDELSILVQVDVKDWIKRSRGVILESCYTSLSNMIMSDVVNKLVEDGHKLQVSVAGTPQKLSLNFGQLVGVIMRDLLELQQRIVRHGTSVGRRKEPCWIYIFGESHCGKSNMMEHLTAEICMHFDLPYTFCARNGQDNFFTTGYKRQSILQIDDLSSVETNPPIEGELINLVSCSDYPLKMADLSDKSISFQSPFIISTSNQRTCLPTCGINDLAAYNNRRAVVLEMRRKPGVMFDPMDPHAAMQGRFLDKRDHTPLYVRNNQAETAWKDVPEMTTTLLNMCAAHRREQEILQDQYTRRHAIHDPLIVASEKFLKAESKKVLCYMPGFEMEKHGVEGAPVGCHYLCVDGVLYTCIDSGELVPTAVENPDYKRWEANCMQGFLCDIQRIDALESRSMIVTGFLRNLVQGQCSILSVDEISATASMAQQRVFKALELQERIYLRLVQKKIDPLLSEEDTNVYSKNAWMKLLDFIASTREYLKDHGLEVLMLAAAMLVLCISLYYFLSAFIALVGGTLSFGAAMAGVQEVDMKAQMSSGAQDSKYRSRNIPVHHRYRYAKSTGGESDIPEAGQLCVALYGANGRFVSALQYKGRSIMLTRHQMLAFHEKERVTCIYLSTGESVILTFSRDDVQEFANHETCLWETAGMMQLPRKFNDYFLENAEVDLAPAFEMEGYVLRTDEQAFHYDALKTWARVQYEPFVVRGTLEREKYVNELPQSIWFTYASRNNDCGMLILAQVKGKKKVVGLLVAGADANSWADILPTPCMAKMKCQMEYNHELGVHTEGYTKLGFLERGKTPTLPKKNNILRVRENLRVPSPVPLKEPSIISKNDARCPSGVDPIKKAFEKKFTQPMASLDDKLLDEIANEIVEEWKDCLTGPLEDVPLETAINGIPAMDADDFFEDAVGDEVECFKMKTSPGYPYVLERHAGMKGKEAYFELAEDGKRKLKDDTLAAELYENIVQYSKSSVPELVVIECPKDELLGRKKIEQGACRLFEIMPLHYNLFLREKTLAFSLFQQEARSKLPCQVGIRAYSREWTHMYQRLVSKSDKAINCDYSGFDGLMTAQVVETIAKMINSVYDSPQESVVSQRQRFNMICALYGRLALVENQVMRVRAGIPSGFALTVVINSIFNEMLMRYCFKRLVPAPIKNSFSTYVTLLVYGDDNLMSCKDVISQYYNGAAIKEELAKVNVTITDGSDKTAPGIEWKPLNELDFLKRRFKKKESGVVQAPLDLSAIFSCLHWITPNPHKLAVGEKATMEGSAVDISYELSLNAQVALTELYLHDDKELFTLVRRFFSEKLPIQEYHTWADREAFHMAKQTSMEKYQPARELDVEVGREFTRFMHVSDLGRTACWYTPLLGVAGPFYKQKEGELLVSMVPLKDGEFGYWVPVEVGTGGGRLPTIAWVKRFGRPSSLRDAYGFLCYGAIAAHIEAGKSVIFRGEAPYVANNAALISFGSSNQLLKQNEALHLYRNVIPEATNGLEKYFDEPIPSASLPGRFFLANEESAVVLASRKTGKVLNVPFGNEGSVLERIRSCLITCQRKNNCPVMAASVQTNSRYYVGLACAREICPLHLTSGISLDAAFDQCWKMQCASASSRKKYDFTKVAKSVTPVTNLRPEYLR